MPESRNIRPDSLDPWEWNPLRHQVARLLGEGLQSERAIAQMCGIDRGTIRCWKAIPAFQERIQWWRDLIASIMLKHAIARRSHRILAKQRRYEKANDLMEARAREHAGAPGGETGLLVRNLKKIGSGDNVETVEEYVFDAALFKAINDLEESARNEVERLIYDRMQEDLDGGDGSSERDASKEGEGSPPEEEDGPDAGPEPLSG